MELAVELIICNKNKRWHSHYEFVNGNGDSAVRELEIIAINQVVDKIDKGEMNEIIKKGDLRYVGVFQSKVLN
ncbi:hypothetical protein LCGC14_0608540 [marine sediment metagenome]|uniref:Uncharacterized protein n=1 Tax=marine sediment metagenome TaxID=412755 RepID=A0A0F9TUN7_9ZZZZ